jgi:predicted transcriptional regulator
MLVTPLQTLKKEETMLTAADQKTPVEIVGSFLDRVPVDLEGMARSLGLGVQRDPDMPSDISGKIEKAGAGYRITVNGKHPPQRQRFTLAHEIAHYVLHRDLIGDGVIDNAMYRSARLSDEIERQANRYAADLLMPAVAVRRLFRREGVRSLADLSERFDVSREAVNIRLKDLGYGA